MLQPANVYPVLVNVFPRTVTVEPAMYGELLSTGTDPPLLPLPKYVTVYGPLGLGVVEPMLMEGHGINPFGLCV